MLVSGSVNPNPYYRKSAGYSAHIFITIGTTTFGKSSFKAREFRCEGVCRLDVLEVTGLIHQASIGFE